MAIVGVGHRVDVTSTPFGEGTPVVVRLAHFQFSGLLERVEGRVAVKIEVDWWSRVRKIVVPE